MTTATTTLRASLERLCEEYRPSRHAFFPALRGAPSSALRDPDVLGELYLRYQAAMHATRVMVYFLPHLDSPPLRARKLRIFIDDDGLQGGDTHHAQLARLFRRIGGRLPLADDEFGDLEPLARRLDPGTARFVEKVSDLYHRSLGPWCIVELVSDDWMRTLADGLAVHHPAVREEAYFAECFQGHVEERHGQEALALTELVLSARPQLLEETLAGAREMAQSLDGLWSSLESVLAAARAPAAAQRGA